MKFFTDKLPQIFHCCKIKFYFVPYGTLLHCFVYPTNMLRLSQNLILLKIIIAPSLNPA